MICIKPDNRTKTDATEDFKKPPAQTRRNNKLINSKIQFISRGIKRVQSADDTDEYIYQSNVRES